MAAASAELVVAIGALAISILAFLTAALQALQQYFGSATGYAACGARVMGRWSVFTRRRMRWAELRLEVQFAVPVVFVAPPRSRRGPLGEHRAGGDEHLRIEYMDGSAASVAATLTVTPDELDRGGQGGGLRTANGELVTWLDLLMAVQRMEGESRAWQRSSFARGACAGDSSSCDGSLSPPPPHTLAVGIQRKLTSWDGMAAGLQRPYAITTISHLVEMAAMLGIHWKEFDRGGQRYRAQGNGFSIRGRHVDGLGVVFSFHKTGPTWFQNHRVVPNDLVKELCFGFAPTIFRPPADRTYLYSDEARDSKTLQLGTVDEMAETLTVFGCSIATVGYFGTKAGACRHSHLFHISFEMLAMVGRVLHIEHTAFRMLPNPTAFPWDVKWPLLRRLLSFYTSELERLGGLDAGRASEALLAAAGHAIRLEDHFRRDLRRPAPAPPNQEADYSRETIAELHAALAACDRRLHEDLPLVEQVFRAHLEAVLGILNDEGNACGDELGLDRRRAPAKMDPPLRGGVCDAALALADMDSAPLENRYMMFVHLYLECVRDRVVEEVEEVARTQRVEVARDGIHDTWCMLVFRMLFWLLLHNFHRKDVQLPKSEFFGSRLAVYIS